MARSGMRFMNMLRYSMFSFTRTPRLGTWVTKISDISLAPLYTVSKHLSWNDHGSRHYSNVELSQKQERGCPICSRNLTFTYKDVLLLSQFLSPEGNILNRRVTGVCRKQQRKLEKAIEISRRLGLIPRKPPALIEKLQRPT